MRSQLGKECRNVFREMIKSEFPDYREDKGQVVPHGWYVWTRAFSTNLYFHVMLVIHHSRDEFTTEGAWSIDGKILPHLSRAREILARPSHVRVGELSSGEDYWWQLVLRPEEYTRALLYKDDPVEECLPLVAPAVRAATEKLKKYLIPVFEKVVQKHGNCPDRSPADA